MSQVMPTLSNLRTLIINGMVIKLALVDIIRDNYCVNEGQRDNLPIGPWISALISDCESNHVGSYPIRVCLNTDTYYLLKHDLRYWIQEEHVK